MKDLVSLRPFNEYPMFRGQRAAFFTMGEGVPVASDSPCATSLKLKYPKLFFLC